MGKSKQWQRRQAADPYVAEARQAGYRCRAAFKLAQLDDRDGFLRAGATVIDLGAAPGGWTQVAVERVGGRGRVLALDRLPMDPVPGAEVLHQDFATEEGLSALHKRLDGLRADVILSDMAPDLSGIKVADQARSMELCELAEDLAGEVLAPGGSLVMKAFQGEGFDELLARLRRGFRRVAPRKPDASRDGSAEQYLVATGFKGN